MPNFTVNIEIPLNGEPRVSVKAASDNHIECAPYCDAINDEFISFSFNLTRTKIFYVYLHARIIAKDLKDNSPTVGAYKHYHNN